MIFGNVPKATLFSLDIFYSHKHTKTLIYTKIFFMIISALVAISHNY